MPDLRFLIMAHASMFSRQVQTSHLLGTHQVAQQIQSLVHQWRRHTLRVWPRWRSALIHHFRFRVLHHGSLHLRHQVSLVGQVVVRQIFWPTHC